VRKITDVRFPGPRYASSEPFPSILSESSPFPYPVPYPLRAPFDHVKPLNLHPSELHMRLIVQAIAAQIDKIWNGSKKGGALGATVPARDFMIIQVPSHELGDGEMETIGQHLKETRSVTAGWEERGGVYIPAGRGSKWIGIDPEPKGGASRR
jgi:ribonuclease Z